MGKHYRVHWCIDVEDVDTPQEAVDEFNRLFLKYRNETIYEVEDRNTGQWWEYDKADMSVTEVTAEKQLNNQ